MVQVEAPAKASAAPVTSARPDKPDAKDGMEAFDATLRIDAAPGGKAFQGVWLERDDGSRWLIAYRAYGYWKPFEGKRVRVSGQRYLPQGQSMAGQHFRVETLTADPNAMTEFVRVAAERTFYGTFEQEMMPVGSKMAGTAIDAFSSAGVRYQLANVPKDKPAPGTKARVTAREVERSPFMAHTGGKHLWIIDITPVD